MKEKNHAPESWARCSLADIVVLNPKNDASAEQTAGFVPMALAPTDYRGTLQHEEKLWGEIKKSYTNFADGDVIFAKVTPCFENGKAAIVRDMPSGIGAGSSEFYVLRPASEEISPNLLFATIKTQSFMQQGAENMTGAVGLRRVPRAFVQSFPTALPPAAEQKVIADKLDTLLTQVESTKARLERIPQILKRFRQSVLAAAVSGRLTEDRRGTPAVSFQQPPLTIGQEKEETPSGWAWHNLVDLAKLESGHTPRKSRPDYWQNGDIPWISLQDIRKAHGKVISETKFMPNMKGIENSSARLLPTGTVCFSRDISVGFTTIMGREMSTTQHFVNWICGPKLNNHYLMYALMAAKDHLTISGQGTTVKTIYMPACKQFRIITPPLEEQTEIVRQVDQLFAHANRIEQQVNKALARVNNLTQSVLAKAFRGELTEQWRKDNPELIKGENSAEALLERIKAERAASQQPKRRKRKA